METMVTTLRHFVWYTIDDRQGTDRTYQYEAESLEAAHAVASNLNKRSDRKAWVTSERI